MLKSKINQRKNVFSDFLHKEGKVSVLEYKQIKRKHPSVLVKSYQYVDNFSECRTSPKEMALIAVNLMNFFDNAPCLDGKPYRIVSIGTSPAPIAEALENLGCEVVYAPISGLRSDISHYKNKKNLDFVMDYLAQKGISCNDSQEKMNILLDFTASGITLDNVEKYLKIQNNVPQEKIWSISICNLIFDVLFANELSIGVPLKVPVENKIDVFRHIKEDMSYSNTETISNIPHFYIVDDENDEHDCSIKSEGKTEKEVFDAFESFSKPLGRAYSLCVINEMMKIK